MREVGDSPSKEAQWLKLLSPKTRYSILDACLVREVEAGHVFYRLGDPPDGIYGVDGGCIHMETTQTTDGPTMLSLFHSGAWLGEVEVFSGMRRLTTLTARRKTKYRFVSAEVIHRIGSDNSDLWKALGHLAAEKLALAVAAMDDLSNRSASVRLSGVILRLCGVRLANGQHAAVAELDVTQSELAQMANLSRGTVFQILSDLEDKGVVERCYGHLKIHDFTELLSDQRTT